MKWCLLAVNILAVVAVTIHLPTLGYSSLRRMMSLLMRFRAKKGRIRLGPTKLRYMQILTTKQRHHHPTTVGLEERGVFSVGPTGASVHQPQSTRYEEVTIDASSLYLSSTAKIGSSLHLPIPWLWINDPCNIQKGSGQKLQTPLSYFASNARIVKASIVPSSTIAVDPRVSRVPKGSMHSVGDMWHSKHLEDQSSSINLLQVTWKTRESTFDSYYSLDWLLERRSSKSLLNNRNYGKFPCIGSATKLFTMDYSQLIPDTSLLPHGDRAAQFQLLDAIFRDGAALLVQVAPCSTNRDDDLVSPVSLVGRLLGGSRISHGHLYGDVFHVETVPDAMNIAYTSVALAPHQDLAYYESPPGLQLLHCVENNQVIGGASTLVDGLAAANALRTLAPSIFRCLAETNATFIKQREKADMSYHRPHIRLDAGGERIVSVHWSPPFEGPLEKVLDGQRANDYFIAHAAFQRMVDNSLPMDQYLLQDVMSNDVEDQLIRYANEHTWEHQLQVGEMLIFNNQRMLHGRRSFTLTSPETSRRHLMGCYTNIDDTLSEYRLLCREYSHGHDIAPSIVGNGSA